jgi:hypothetical protein
MKAPWLPSQRGSFHSQYIVPKGARDKSKTWPRLLDRLLCVAQVDDPDYLSPCGDMEFAVIDFATHEKAWFDMPPGATPDVLTRMVEEAFAATAFRADPKLWVV